MQAHIFFESGGVKGGELNFGLASFKGVCVSGGVGLETTTIKLQSSTNSRKY